MAIDGPIGVGKSSLAKLLCERLAGTPVFEKVEENPFLADFYKDAKGSAFQTQIFFLISRYKQLTGHALGNPASVMVCDYLFERDLVFAKLNLNEHEYQMYMEIYSLLKEKIPAPDLIVYLQADTDSLMKRIKKRQRVIEKGVTRKYIEKVNTAFNDFFFNYKPGPLLIINTSQIDFVNNEGDLDNLLQKIGGDIRGVEYFNPISST